VIRVVLRCPLDPGTGSPAPTVDIHAHTVVPTVEPLIRDRYASSLDPFMRFGGESTAYNESLAPTLIPMLTDPGRRLETMDRQGIRWQAISIAPPHYHYWADADLGARIARVQNDGIADLVARHPDRFVGLGTVPMQAPDEAIVELDRVVAELRFPGVAISPSAEGHDYDEPAYIGFWQHVETLDAVVVLHPNGFADGARLSRYYMINVVGNPIETTVALTHLVLGGVLERHPGLRVVAVHGGGYLPFYADRWDHAYANRPEVGRHISRPPSSYLQMLYYDSVVFGSGLDRLVELVGADRVVMGTDYPYDMGDPDPLGRIGRLKALTPSQRAAIAGGTAAGLLGLPDPGGGAPGAGFEAAGS
jgi:aminocarboxymuconate-semialdehyde decarboxylase